MNLDAQVLTVLHKLTRHLNLCPLLDVVENLLIVRLKPDQQQPQSVIAQLLQGVIVQIGAGVAAPGQAQLPHVLANGDRLRGSALGRH